MQVKLYHALFSAVVAFALSFTLFVLLNSTTWITIYALLKHGDVFSETNHHYVYYNHLKDFSGVFLDRFFFSVWISFVFFLVLFGLGLYVFENRFALAVYVFCILVLIYLLCDLLNDALVLLTVLR